MGRKESNKAKQMGLNTRRHDFVAANNNFIGPACTSAQSDQGHFYVLSGKCNR